MAACPATKRQSTGQLGVVSGAATRQLAVGRLLEIIGEAANSMSEEFRSRHPDIPWRDIIGLHVLLAHHYHRIDPGQVWVIAAAEVPRLVQDIRPAG
jgi:uncharacterized protein with HEPN domain